MEPKRVFLTRLLTSIETKNAAIHKTMEWKKYPSEDVKSHRSPAIRPKPRLTISLSNMAIEIHTGIKSIAFAENI